MATGKKALWLTTSKIATTGITMIVTMLLSRFRTLEEYGTYSQINIITTVVSAIFVMGLPSSVSYFLNKADNEIEKQRFLSTYFSFGTILGLGIAVIIFAIYPLFVSYFNNDLLNTYKFAVLLLPWIGIFNSSVENIFISYNRVKLLIIYRLTYSVMLLAVVAAFSWCNGSFYTYMHVYCALQVMFVVGLYVLTYFISGKIGALVDKNIAKEMLLFSVPLGFSNIISTLNIELDKIMVGRIFNTDQLAIYTNMSKELPLNMLTVSVTTLLLPKIVSFVKNRKWNEAIRFWGVAIELSAVIICFVSAMLFAYSDTVIRILYSDKYISGNLIFKIYTITSLVKITSWGILLNSSNNTKKIFHASLLTLGCNFILNLLLMRWFGIAGAAIATLVSEFFGIAIKLKYSANISGVSIRRIIPWASLTKIVCICAALCALAIVMNKGWNAVFDNQLIGVVISGFVTLLVYVGIMLKPTKKRWRELNTY